MQLFEHNLEEGLEKQDQEMNSRDIQLHNRMDSLQMKMDKIHFDIIDNEDNLAVTYVNSNGKVEYGAIRKAIPDNITLKYDADKKFALKYNFDKTDLPINNNTISVRGMTLVTGKHITADRINNDLNNATSNIQSLTRKVSNILERLHTVNGYVASNNFKKATPTEEQLYNFAMNCLSTSEHTVTKEQIPCATKIKNTFDNHIWILNRVTIDGLTTSKWEDFGSDNICIASNDGVHGLVTGSQDRYRGHIDLQGTISINGLEEELSEILKSIQNINNDLSQIQQEFSAKLNSLEDRIRRLEA